MTNWLADPAVCAIKAIKKGCHIMAGRNEVMSRATTVVRTENADGVRWAWGHLAAERRTFDGGTDIRLVVTDVNGSVTNIESTPRLTPNHATVASDLLRAAAVDAGGQACAGKSILEMLWDELDTIMERLMTRTGADDLRDPGRAEGVAYAIAMMQNPYRVNVDAVREQAVARWEAAQEAAPAAPAARAKPDLTARRAARRARRAR